MSEEDFHIKLRIKYALRCDSAGDRGLSGCYSRFFPQKVKVSYFPGQGLALFVCGSHFGYHLNYMAARRDTIARTVNIYTRVMRAGTPLLLAWNVGPPHKIENIVCWKCMQK